MGDTAVVKVQRSVEEVELNIAFRRSIEKPGEQ